MFARVIEVTAPKTVVIPEILYAQGYKGCSPIPPQTQRGGCCWAHAAARVIQSTLCRVCDHEMGGGFRAYADGEASFDQLQARLTNDYERLVKRLIAEGERFGFGGKDGEGGWPEDAVKHVCRNWFTFFGMERYGYSFSKIESYIYDSAYLPRSLLITIWYPKGFLSPYRHSLTLDAAAVHAYSPWGHSSGHAMAIVGVAHTNGKRYLVLVNSWGTVVHDLGAGFWLLEDDAAMMARLGAQIVAVGYNKFQPSYEPYQRAWNRLSASQRRSWAEALIQIHNRQIRHVPGIRLAEYRESLELKRG